jgi:hypothetical protein
MLAEARPQLGDLGFQRRDPGERSLELQLLILHDLHKRTHDRLDARRRVRPISFRNP